MVAVAQHMKNIQDNYVTLAIQKNGRLADSSASFLRKAGLDFEPYTKRLLCVCKNFPLNILYVRNADIPMLVSSGAADLGITGRNSLIENRFKVTQLCSLPFGNCSLEIAIPTASNIRSITDLQSTTIASSYPASTRTFLQQNNVTATILPLTGSVEIAPLLGIASAICDLVYTGETLATNGLKPFQTVYTSTAILIGNTLSQANRYKKESMNQLLKKFQRENI